MEEQSMNKRKPVRGIPAPEDQKIRTSPVDDIMPDSGDSDGHDTTEQVSDEERVRPYWILFW